MKTLKIMKTIEGNAVKQRDEKGRFMSKSKTATTTGNTPPSGTTQPTLPRPPVLPGQYISITGAPESLYLLAVFKAFREFFIDDFMGFGNSADRFKSKINSAKELFPEDRKKLYENVDNLRVHSNYEKYFDC
jgi:hypothetical protein